MCLSPVSIINPSKYVSTRFRDRFILQVPCNNCAECQQNKSSEWLYRTYYQFLDCLSNTNSFVMFDTLTYNEENLPHISDICDGLPGVPCFRSKDVVDFMKRLRINLERKFVGVKCSYFVSSEYGSKFGRPHYHLLLFVVGNITPYDVSLLISQCWKHGITDGIPYKPYGYVYFHNTIMSHKTADILSAANYVTKYVQKDCHLQDVLDKRIKYCDLIISSDKIPFVKSNSVAASRLRQKIKSEVNQFHLQSLHYGELALCDMDMIQLANDGYLLMPSKESVLRKLAVPMYYKRKLFYDKVLVNKMPTWQLNDFGKKYVKLREPQLLKNLSDRYKCIGILLKLEYDYKALADYVLNYRGRYVNTERESNDIMERLDNVNYYNYVTRTDKENVGLGLSVDFIGNSALGYVPLTNFIPIKTFISDNVYFDEDKEKVLTRLYNRIEPLDKGKQEYYSLVQHLEALYKSLNI